MRTSYRIAKIAGISIEVHITFLLFLLFVFMVSGAYGLASGIGTIFLFGIIFSIVLFHELVHSFVAIRLGISVPRIVLLPIGGLASVDIPDNAERELVIAIAGPLSNFFLAGLSILILFLVVQNPLAALQENLPQVTRLDPEGFTGAIFTLPGILSSLIFFNLMLGFFNMLPGFPMDGGRVFRAVLALWMNRLTATRIAVRIGQVIFIFMILMGLFGGSFWFLIIGTFLFFASGSELKMVALSSRIDEKVKVGDITTKKFTIVEAKAKIEDFIKKTAKPDQRFYPIIDSKKGAIVGVFDIADLRNVKKSEGKVKEIKDFARTFPVISESTKIRKRLTDLISNDFFIVHSAKSKKKVVGYITPGHVLSFVEFQEKIGK